jgi:hypothetical protein
VRVFGFPENQSPKPQNEKNNNKQPTLSGCKNYLHGQVQHKLAAMPVQPFEGLMAAGFIMHLQCAAGRSIS